MTSHYSNEKYHLLNKRLSAELFENRYPVRFYQNASSALYDMTVGLQQYLAHRQQLGLVKEGSSLIEALVPNWLRQAVPLQQKTEQQTWPEYIETLSTETNFVVWSSENEITGEVLVCEKDALEIHERLSKKRIFSIQITQQQKFTSALSSYEILVMRKSIFQDDACLVVMSEKMKAASLIGSFQQSDQITTNTFKQSACSMKDLQMIESQLLDLNALYFKQRLTTPNRLTDRIILSFDDLNAYALQQDLGLSDHFCLAPARYPFWVLDQWAKWWKECGKEELLRGLLVISSEAFFDDPQLVDKIHVSVDKIRRLGQWNVLP